MDRELVLIAHNVRSAHNVGSLLRTADGLGVSRVYLTGYTPYPIHAGDRRLPHQAQKVTQQIHKTALGAETTVTWKQCTDITKVIATVRSEGLMVVALEQTAQSTALHSFHLPQRLAIIVGREVEGLEAEVLKLADRAIMIPMLGQKESFNVVQAAAMALYYCRFMA